MLSAAVLPFTACQTGNEGTDGNGDGNGTGSTPEPVVPTVVVNLEEGSVTATSFFATVVTTDAEEAAWMTTEHGATAPEAAAVFENGTALALPEGGPAFIQADGLTPETHYDLYVAVSNGDNKVVSDVVCVTTLAAEVVPPTPAVQVIEWYAMADPMPAAAKGESALLQDHNFQLPGHFLYLSGYDWSDEEEDFVYARGANLFMVDFDFANEGLESCVYLTSHHYPVVSAGVSLPTASCLVADMSMFTVGDKEYYVVAPETETDADGNPYGVTVMSYCAMGMDMNQLLLNVPAVDSEGNPVVIVGQYVGALGYNLAGGGGAPSKMEEDLNLDTWRITNFTGKADKENNLLVLKANGGGGFLTLNLWLGEDGAKEWANADGVVWNAQVDELDQPMGPLTGVFDNDPYYCTATTGGFTLYTTETEGQYLLVPHRNGGLKFVGEQIVYTLVRPDNETGGYTVTITMQE